MPADCAGLSSGRALRGPVGLVRRTRCEMSAWRQQRSFHGRHSAIEGYKLANYDGASPVRIRNRKLFEKS